MGWSAGEIRPGEGQVSEWGRGRQVGDGRHPGPGLTTGASRASRWYPMGDTLGRGSDKQT